MTDFTLSPDVGAEVSLFPWIIDSLVVYIFEVDAPQYASFIGEKLHREIVPGTELFRRQSFESDQTTLCKSAIKTEVELF